MALVLGRGHGGDNGPPNDDVPWQPPSVCKNEKARKKARDLSLKKKFADNQRKPLPIEFDIIDQETVKPTGSNARDFTSLISNEIERKVPFYYDSWENIPQSFKTTLWPKIKGFFNIVPWLEVPHGVLIEKGTTASFKGRWKDRKSNFKKHEFVLRDGYKEPIKIRDFPPTDIKIDEWRKLCDHFTSEKHLKRSRSSKVNRSKQLYSSNQGTRSYAQSRHEEFNEETGEFPDLIDHFRAKHMKGGKWNHPVAEERYKKMIELREAQEGRDTPLTVDQIMSQVLGVSRGFKPGRGRKLPNSASASSSCCAHSDPPASPMMSQGAWAKSFVANQDQIAQIYQLFVNKNMQVPVPTLLKPAQFLDVVRDPPEDDGAPGDDAAPGDDLLNILCF